LGNTYFLREKRVLVFFFVKPSAIVSPFNGILINLFFFLEKEREREGERETERGSEREEREGERVKERERRRKRKRRRKRRRREGLPTFSILLS
jgi:hypothetical protein